MIAPNLYGKGILLLGQSNMMNFGTIGVAYPSGWPTQALGAGYSDVIWNILTQSWEQYVAGINSEVVPSGSSAWGPETGIALQKRGKSPQRSNYMIKYAVGGVGLAQVSGNDWSPFSAGKAFEAAMAQIDAAKASLAAYTRLQITETYWVGNETDTQSATAAAAIARDLVDLPDAIRAHVGNADMKFIIAGVKQGSPNGTWTNDVRTVQMAVGALRRNAYVETNGLSWGAQSSGHYDANQQVPFGTLLANAADAIVL